MIELKIGLDGVPSTNRIILGNKYENNDEVISFTFPEEYTDHYKYIIAVMRGKEDGTVILPIVDNLFYVSTAITRYEGSWAMYAMCRDYEVNCEKETVDISAKRNEHVFISDGFTGIVNKNLIEKENVDNLGLDTNLKVMYDDLITLRCELMKLINNENNIISNVPALNGVKLTGIKKIEDFGYHPIFPISISEISFYESLEQIKTNQMLNNFIGVLQEDYLYQDEILIPKNKTISIFYIEDKYIIKFDNYIIELNSEGVLSVTRNEYINQEIDEMLSKKLDIQQNLDDIGKILYINENGLLSPIFLNELDGITDNEVDELLKEVLGDGY